MPADDCSIDTLWYVMDDKSVTDDVDVAKDGVCLGVVEANCEEEAIKIAKSKGVIND